MERTCVLVADRLRARLFALEPIADLNHSFQLEEKVELINRYTQRSYEHQADISHVAALPRSGSSAVYEPSQGDQDHEDRKFAKEVTQELVGYLKTIRADQLILVAPPQFLGALREHKQALRSEVTDIHDFAKQLAHLSIPEIQDYLEQKIVL